MARRWIHGLPTRGSRDITKRWTQVAFRVGFNLKFICCDLGYRGRYHAQLIWSATHYFSYYSWESSVTFDLRHELRAGRTVFTHGIGSCMDFIADALSKGVSTYEHLRRQKPETLSLHASCWRGVFACVFLGFPLLSAWVCLGMTVDVWIQIRNAIFS